MTTLICVLNNVPYNTIFYRYTIKYVHFRSSGTETHYSQQHKIHKKQNANEFHISPEAMLYFHTKRAING